MDVYFGELKLDNDRVMCLCTPKGQNQPILRELTIVPPAILERLRAGHKVTFDEYFTLRYNTNLL